MSEPYYTSSSTATQGSIAVPEIFYSDESVTLWHGDCLDVLAGIPDSSIDAVVTDPPYGLEFMGRKWDGDAGFLESLSATGRGARVATERAGELTERGSGHSTSAGPYLAAGVDSVRVAGRPFQDWCHAWATECLRVLKPGGMIAAFGGTRTFHRLACAIEDAGFEIRDSIGYGTEERPGLLAWAYGSGFPKSLNVTKALEALPACSCSVASLSGEPAPIVEASIPPSSVGARAGAEAGAMSSARSTADETVGVGPQVVASRAPDCGVSDVDALDVDGSGQALPVVLRPSSVAGAAEGQEVVGLVGGVKVNPESLRDQMVGDEPVTAAAIGALPVTLDDCGCNVHPASPLVFPLATTPGRVAAPRHTVTVGGRHAGAGAVDATVGPAAELISADDADVDAVSLTLHASHSTPERMVRCEACGGIRGGIPQGLGTALKPAWEPIVLARKPLAGTVAANVLLHGTGALNIDGCRVEVHDGPRVQGAQRETGATNFGGARAGGKVYDLGRWPTNVVLDSTQAAVLDEMSGVSTSRVGKPRGSDAGDGWGMTATGAEYADTGGASRFFPTFRYEAKAPGSERPRVPKRRLRLRDDLTPEQVDHVRARLAEAGVQVD